MKHVARYLAGTMDYGITINPNGGNAFVTYADANFGDQQTLYFPTSGKLSYIGSTIFSWSSKKQTAICTSTYEAEYVASVTGIKEMMGTTQLLEEIAIYSI